MRYWLFLFPRAGGLGGMFDLMGKYSSLNEVYESIPHDANGVLPDYIYQIYDWQEDRLVDTNDVPRSEV